MATPAVAQRGDIFDKSITRIISKIRFRSVAVETIFAKREGLFFAEKRGTNKATKDIKGIKKIRKLRGSAEGRYAGV